jgi:hypothetical protein
MRAEYARATICRWSGRLKAVFSTVGFVRDEDFGDPVTGEPEELLVCI